ncbi:hypothetical protein [Streptomyces sp. SYP-A7185]|uniref:hypothetical protein n=1 Tax=Streptomyces sp. SYP-A7185 TaxID=3040076 RepID=UPI0038F62BEF
MGRRGAAAMVMRSWFGGGGKRGELVGGMPGDSLRDVLDVSDPAAWIAFDSDMRGMFSHPGVVKAKESQVAFALCSRDGRVRERAVRRAARHPVLLPLVVIRCADWAAPVREKARGLLRDTLPRLGAAELASLAPVLLRVGRRERGAFGVELLREVVSGTAGDAAGETTGDAAGERLVALLGHGDPVVRRFAHRIAVDAHAQPVAELARVAVHDRDVVIQNLCADAALAGLGEAAGEGAYRDVVVPLLGARTPRVRSAGVTALRRVGRPEAAREYLTDRSALVRACARYVLRQSGTDPLPLYRAWCADPGDAALPPGAPVGLAECGVRTDAGLLLPLLAHEVSGVRARAVAGLRLLDVACGEEVRVLLDDPAPAVAREASAALLPGARQLPTEWLMARLGPGLPRHTRVAAFRLLCAQDEASRRRAAAALLEDADAKLRFRAGQVVRSL